MSKAPNILLVLVDDLGWRDLGCTGSSFYETPHLDQLAREGIRLPQAYAACPVCSPTRASLMTGKYPATVGITQYLGGHNVGELCEVPFHDRLPASEYTLAEALRREGGYQTWHVGKWHLGPPDAWPTRRGFDVNLGGCEMGGPHRKGHFAPWEIPTLKEGEPGEYLCDRLATEAVRLIAERDPSRPFFLNFWPYAVHTPLQAPADLVAKYEAKAKALGLEMFGAALAEGETMPSLRHLQTRVQRRQWQSHPVYAAMVENLDTNVGRLLAALDTAGLRDDTLVVFTSDNGGLATAEGSPTCNLPLAEGKGWMYDGGLRVPLLARWPGRLAPGAVFEEPTTTPDLYPTLLAAAGLAADPRQCVDGVNVLPLWQGQPQARGPLFWHFPHYSNQGGSPGCAVRRGPWKLIEFFGRGHIELYHLGDDPGETVDRAPTEPAVCAELLRELRQWRERVGALVPRPNPWWPPVAPAKP